jgi:hypothetical protein
VVKLDQYTIISNANIKEVSGGNVDKKRKVSEDDVVLKIKALKEADTKDISELINKIGINRVRRSISYYPFRFFADGVDAYRYSFNNAVIYYVGTAVEIGLLIKLKPIVEQEKQTNPRFSPKFSWLINNSEPLLGEVLKSIADQVRIMRNCYVHYENIVAHTAWLNQVAWPEIVKYTKSKYKDHPEIIKVIEALAESEKETREKEGMLTIRFDFLETNQEIMTSMESRYDEYLKWLPKFWPTKKHIMNFDLFRLTYDIECFDALSCIKWGFDILRKLDYIRENR